MWTRDLILLFSYGLLIVSTFLKIPLFPRWMKFLLCYQSYPHIYEFFPDSLFYLLVYNITLLFFYSFMICFDVWKNKSSHHIIFKRVLALLILDILSKF